MSKQKWTQTPNIHPNPENYIERKDEIRRIVNFIEKTEGAVIGITGVRGSGKTTVMESIISQYQKGNFTLRITSPTEYDEKEFFVMVFKRICEEVNKKIEEELKIRESITRIGIKEKLKYIALSFFFFLISSFFGFWILNYLFYGNYFLYYYEFPPLSNISFISWIFITIVILILSIGLANYLIRGKSRIFANSRMIGLYLLTQETLENLMYEKTISQKAEAKIGVFEQIFVFLKGGKELKTRSFTLPGLTSEYNNYILNVMEAFGGKIIICIDELDKIADPESVKRLLKGIKGALFQKYCYYLISISEDAVISFRERISKERDILESTFDEIISLERTSIDIARKIVKKWLGYKQKEEISREIDISINIMSILSGGIPRELLRNLREVLMELEINITPTEVWEILFRIKISDFKNAVRMASIDEDIGMQIYVIADQIASDHPIGEKKLRERIEKIHEILKSWKSSKKEEITQEVERLERSVLELKISVVVYECMKKDIFDHKEILCNLLTAYSILPYNKRLSDKYINDSMVLLYSTS